MSQPYPMPDIGGVDLPHEPWSQRLLTGVGSVLDASMLRAAQLVVERALIPDEEDLLALRESSNEAISPELQGTPERFFDFLDHDADPDDVGRLYHRPLEGGGVWKYELRTCYEPYGFDHDATPSGQPILVERWMHDRRPARGTILTLHGFAMGNPQIDAFAMLATDWYQRGLDVALMTLPYHSKRTPEDAHFSGDRFAVPHVTLLGDAVREAIYEVQLVTRWLKGDTSAPVGLLGLSLGGYLTALFAGVSNEADFAIPMVAPVCIGDLAWRFMSKTRHSKNGTISTFDQQQLRTAFRVHSPLTHALKIDRDSTLIIGGRGDRIVPPEHPSALWKHWGRPRIHWFSGSHLAPFGRREVVDVIAEHLRRIHIL